MASMVSLVNTQQILCHAVPDSSHTYSPQSAGHVLAKATLSTCLPTEAWKIIQPTGLSDLHYNLGVRSHLAQQRLAHGKRGSIAAKPTLQNPLSILPIIKVQQPRKPRPPSQKSPKTPGKKKIIGCHFVTFAQHIVPHSYHHVFSPQKKSDGKLPPLFFGCFACQGKYVDVMLQGPMISSCWWQARQEAIQIVGTGATNTSSIRWSFLFLSHFHHDFPMLSIYMYINKIFSVGERSWRFMNVYLYIQTSRTKLGFGQSYLLEKPRARY